MTCYWPLLDRALQWKQLSFENRDLLDPQWPQQWGFYLYCVLRHPQSTPDICCIWWDVLEWGMREKKLTQYWNNIRKWERVYGFLWWDVYRQSEIFFEAHTFFVFVGNIDFRLLQNQHITRIYKSRIKPKMTKIFLQKKEQWSQWRRINAVETNYIIELFIVRMRKCESMRVWECI